MGRPTGGTTLPQLAVFTDWAEQRLLMVNVEAQLEKVLLLVLDDGPVARAVQEAKDMLANRSTVRERLSDPESLLEDPDSVVPNFTKAGPRITELPESFVQAAPPRVIKRPARGKPAQPEPAAPTVSHWTMTADDDPEPIVDKATGGVRDLIPDPFGPKRSRLTPAAPSEREQSILQILSEGKSNQDIGEVLGMPANTVKSSLGRMITRYRAGDRAGLAAMALRNGWIE